MFRNRSHTRSSNRKTRQRSFLIREMEARKMKNRIVIGFSTLALALVAGTAMAGDYHSGTSAVCADCHTMHYSQQHDFAGGPAPTFDAAGPFERLLKNDPNKLCLSCHDNQADTADVVGVNTGNAGDVRQAGALNLDSHLGANDPGYDTYMGHTIGAKGVTAPGGTFVTSAIEGLACVDCHTPHGSGRNAKDLKGVTITSPYRNVLAPNPAGGFNSISYEIGATSTNNFDVLEREARNYDQSNVDFEKPVATESAYGKYCMSCHTQFHGSASNPNNGDVYDGVEFVRHPTAESIVSSSTYKGASYGKTNFVKVMSDTSAWGANATNGSPSCFSCHKAHGNKNAFGLIHMAGNTGAISEEGSTVNTGMRSLCKQCHSMGGSIL